MEWADHIRDQHFMLQREPLVRDAAIALPDAKAVRRAAGSVRPAAQGGVGHRAHGAAACGPAASGQYAGV
ncbi:hypothetical protein G6F24_018671 [Rhizopus arrhizus]|nr:hypothetical protein G6F24_018671 [Rhizopus arrhizus]